MRAFSTGIVAPDSEQATGARKEELEAEAAGETRFNREPLRVGAQVGTKENPILVPSQMSERVVGLTEPHRETPRWFVMMQGKTYYVPTADKYFKLFDPQGKYYPMDSQA
jgi:hypothetical protein